MKLLFMSFIFCYFVSSGFCFGSSRKRKPAETVSGSHLKQGRSVNRFVSAEFFEDEIRTDEKVTINCVT